MSMPFTMIHFQLVLSIVPFVCGFVVVLGSQIDPYVGLKTRGV